MAVIHVLSSFAMIDVEKNHPVNITHGKGVSFTLLIHVSYWLQNNAFSNLQMLSMRLML